ncbi:ZN358-like protein [Mya arenaria]|uniref:ZN358-like protein n=1 Tax=Mya arenaria TaxID=6604 RepID=A0ABY7G4X5_MYAAR|nr:ZN358-like protein [Mya arenaria]
MYLYCAAAAAVAVAAAAVAAAAAAAAAVVAAADTLQCSADTLDWFYRLAKKMPQYVCEQCGASFPKLSQLLQHRRTANHWKHKCESCKKSFSRKQNLDRHLLKHNNDNNQHCPECLKVFTREDALNEHMHREHDWPRTKRASDDQEEATYFKVDIKDLEVDGLPNILKTLKTVFQSILDTIAKDIAGTDLVRVSLDNPELDFPITLEFMPRYQLTADRILAEIERVLQSYQQFVVDESFRIDIVHVQNPYGKGHKQKAYVDLPKSLQSKRCIIQINNKDDLCCARAIITAIARHENHPQWNSIRQGCAIQRQLAEELHKKAGVPLQRCGIEEVKKFQAVLPNYQIHVLSKEHFNGIIYDGIEGGVPINLYHHDEHFDVITKMTGFLNRIYFCLRCKKGYDHKEKHSCNNPCVYCHKTHSDEEEKWTFCSRCKRNFKSDMCYQMHLKTSDAGKSICTTYFKCQKCDQTINLNRHKRSHVCHEFFCKTCKDFVTEDHLCYMQPVKEDTSSCKLAKKKDNLTSYIFFDFECTQDEQLQCEGGFTKDKNGKCGNCKKSWCGSFEHRPNLCIAHKVCEKCLQNPVTSQSTCKACGKNERESIAIIPSHGYRPEEKQSVLAYQLLAYLSHYPTKSGHTSICKVRGITLNFKNSLDINFQTVKDMVTGKGKDCVTVIDENKIVRNPSTGHIITKRENKDYKIVFDKRVIGNAYTTFPYGY